MSDTFCELHDVVCKSDPVLKGDFVHRGAAPLVAVAAEGSTITADDGRLWIDLQASSGACILGYSDRHLRGALRRLKTLPAKPQFCESNTRRELAESIVGRIAEETGKVGAVGFDLGGAQAIEQAIKIVSSSRAYADTVLVLDGAYHGRSISVAHLSCSPRYRTGATHSPFRVIRIPVPELVARRMNCSLEAATETCIAHVDSLFEDERFGLAGSGQRLHSIILEPYLNVAGMVPLGRAYALHLAEKVHRAGGCVIVDEIFTGVYRFGSFLSAAFLTSVADVVVLSKGLTNALAPLSAIWVNQSSGLHLTYSPGSHSSTYINNELALAIALEVMQEIDTLSEAELQWTGRRMRDWLKYAPLDPQHTSSWSEGNVARIDFRSERAFREFNQAVASARSAGVLMATTGLAKNTAILHPSLTISDRELTLGMQILSEGLQQCSA